MNKEISNFPQQYNPLENEKEIYNLWETSGDFTVKDSEKEPFVVMIPPPNVTGVLHMGHALNNTLIDILIRKARMEGRPTLWVPGTDHAGIATQNKVEKKLAKENKSRNDLGREKFIEEVWAWKQEYGDQIKLQLKSLGASCDWNHERFTMDEKYSEAVNKAFDHYYKKGWIYQGERLVNWCVRCASAISDLEVNHTQEKTQLVYIKYPIKNSDKFITVATTRAETMLADTAVAVNPKDSRYLDLIGKTVILPIVGREIPIIGDASVEQNFASGAVKVTPGHSMVDWEIGERHKLDVISVVNEKGKLEAPKAYVGLKTIEARKAVFDELTHLNLIAKVEEINHNIARCDRCDSIIEPLVSKQWFLKMEELVKPAIKAVEDGEVVFYPKQYKEIYLEWMKNIRDWCISRQIWWGHKIPIEGSEDVLDTWFSSALWPFATLGWPNQSEDLAKYYPTSVLLTAKDILYLWVARMIFSGYEFMGKKPFEKVYLHPTVLNKEGRRMSKSLGTGLDPMELIRTYGADATRFGLVWQTLGLQQFKFSPEPIIAGKKFINKLWNAVRFAIINIDAEIDDQFEPKTDSDKAILGQLKETTKQMNEDLEQFRFGQALQEFYRFFWHDFCDEYIEKSKQQLADAQNKANTQKILVFVIISSLKLLHPFMPFVSERLWQNLKELKLVKQDRLING